MMKSRMTVIGAGLLAAALATLMLARCGGNPDDTLLDPFGESILAEGVVTGLLDWGEGPPYPLTVVYAIPSYNPGCTGGPTSVHVTGENVNWETGIWETTPGMTELFPCLWLGQENLPADDQFEWKFVTSKSWDGSYAAGGSGVDETARRGTTVNTNGDNLRVSIPSAGEYSFLLNASTDPGYFWVLAADQSLWDTTGVDSTRFTIENLAPGTYTIIIHVPDEPETFPVRYVRGVRVSGDAGVDLGTVSVILTGALQGMVAFSDGPAETPEVRIIASLSETGAPVDTTTLPAGTTVFSITGLNEDTYDLRFHAEGYVDTILTDIEFLADEEIVLGTITLARGGAVSGTVAFADSPGTLPIATIFYEEPAGRVRLAETTSDPVDGSFVLGGVPAGSVDIGIRARKYVDTTLAEVVVAAAETTEVGTVAMRPGCVSVAEAIHMLGEFNGWNENLWMTDPGMLRIESCLWIDTIEVFPDAIADVPFVEFKFVTDRNYNDPPDYVRCDSLVSRDNITYWPICLVPDGPNLVFIVLNAGRFQVTLDEDSLQYRVLSIEEFDSRIVGSVAFDTGRQPPFPSIEIEVRKAGKDFVVARTDVDADLGTFTVDDLDGGAYDVAFIGTTLRDTTVSGVVVADGGTANLGTVVLTEVTCQSEFTIIRVVGDFNTWNTGAPSMTQIQPCLWVDTLVVAARPPDNCHFMKFRTGNDWGANDYGNCGPEDNTCSTPLAGSICHGSGTSEPAALGKIKLNPGTYEFRLDEANRTYTITLLR
ncbi:MAG: hypothetical protein ABIH26_05635 [Candidatus Eisenbacteria bacterium]